jgi:hypothetical protein
MDYEKQLKEAEEELIFLCKRNKIYECQERNDLIKKITKLHNKINQMKQKKAT